MHNLAWPGEKQAGKVWEGILDIPGSMPSAELARIQPMARK